jgi:hypothetical protein
MPRIQMSLRSHGFGGVVVPERGDLSRNLAGLVMGSRLVGSDRDCSRLTGDAEVIPETRFAPLLPACRPPGNNPVCGHKRVSGPNSTFEQLRYNSCKTLALQSTRIDYTVYPPNHRPEMPCWDFRTVATAPARSKEIGSMGTIAATLTSRERVRHRQTSGLSGCGNYIA